MSDLRHTNSPSIDIREIRGLEHREAIALSRMRRALDLNDAVTADWVLDELDHLVRSGGWAWIARRQQTVTGYASIMPAPGLPGLYELECFVGPAHQRQGLGSALLRKLIDQLTGSSVKQLFCAAPSSECPAAQFLFKNGFFVEHEELMLVVDDPAASPGLDLAVDYSLRTFSEPEAIAHFRQLYEASFKGLAWYQPYEDDEEVASELADADDLLFLAYRGRPIGFLWLRWPDLATAVIEPVGLSPRYQGRGLGRQLVRAGIQRAARQGAGQVVVGAWRTNTAALALYTQLGFRPSHSKIYLAYDL